MMRTELSDWTRTKKAIGLLPRALQAVIYDAGITATLGRRVEDELHIAVPVSEQTEKALAAVALFGKEIHIGADAQERYILLRVGAEDRLLLRPE